ncbi:terpene synthase family protein [Streptomyces sp. NPDC088097]|uniref:terpene synthase family protein n=1 Tax=Streptomyces sp. NPDC088097 TaxID=3365823 RepID=UPI003818885F
MTPSQEATRSQPTTRPCPGLSPGTQFHLPELAQRFSCDYHPDYHAIVRSNEQWVVQSLYAGDTDRARASLNCLTGLMICTGYPQGDRDRMLDICQLSEWWFLIDDEFTHILSDQRIPEQDRPPLARRYLDDMWSLVLGEPATTSPAWSPDAVRALFKRIRSRLEPAAFDRMLTAFATWQQDGLTTEQQTPDISALDLPAYLQIRRDSTACTSYATITEYVLDIEIPPQTLNHPLVQEYQRTIMNCWILPSDLFSFRKECFHGDHTNAVCLLRRTQQLSLQEAVDTLASHQAESQEQALDLYAQIAATPLGTSGDLLTYLATLQQIEAATQRWCYMTPRYHGDGFHWNGALSGTMTLYPDYTQFPPIHARSPQPTQTP